MSGDTATSAAFFRALSHPARLMVLRLTWTQALSGEHLARLLNLSPATVSSHLTQLTEAGLLSAQQDGHQKMFQVRKAAFDLSLAALVRGDMEAATPTAGNLSAGNLSAGNLSAEDPYRERVLRAFIRQGKLSAIPAQRKKKDVILNYLAELFEPGRQYPEREVNAILGEYHPDFFTLRREMVGLGVLERSAGVYWRPEKTAAEATPDSSDSSLLT